MHDKLAQDLRRMEGVIWVESDNASGISAAGVVLSSLLQGESTDKFPAVPSGDLVVLNQGSVLNFGPIHQALSELSTKIDLVGGYDWAIVLHPEETVKVLERGSQ